MRTDHSVVSRPSDNSFGRQTKGRENTAHGRNSIRLLIATAVLGLGLAGLAGAPLAHAQAISVGVTPNPAQAVPGSALQLTATVTGTGDSLVVWSLSGPGCSGMSCGTISGEGLYTAPPSAPNPPTVYATATSLADFSTTGKATITIIPPAPVQVTLSPAKVTLGVGGLQQFTATVTGSKNTAVNWNVVGDGCIGFYCGGLLPSGLYMAPSQFPNPPTVTLTATSVADPSKSASATITLGSAVSVTVTPPNPQVLLGQQLPFGATVTGSNNTAVQWSVSGVGCSGLGCGAIDANGVYTAPPTMPTIPNVTVTAAAVADASKNAAATVTLVAAAGVTVQPGSIHVLPKGQQGFSATVAGTPNQQVTWNLSGAGCAGVTCGTINAVGQYTAPAVIPTPNLVLVKATSVALPNLSGTANVFVGAASPVVVTVTPSPADVPVGKTQQFAAKVTGTNNTAVNWIVVGGGCEPNCGSISSTGLYTAPATPPPIPVVDVIAVSVADPTRSGSSFVSITQNIVVTVTPSPVALKTGAAQQFTANVTGTANVKVNWTVSGAGCAGMACGTITATGLYTAPAVAPKPAGVTVTATSQADAAAFGSATVTIGTPIKITVAPPDPNVVVGGQQKFAATVTGNANTAVTWSLSGASCPNACGSIDAAGLYTAPAAVPNSKVTVVATSQADGVSFGTATVTVITKNESNLKGQFAFLFRGKDANGFFQAAGSFTADGSGTISSGVEDINRTSGPLTNLVLSGTYTVSGDNRGTLTLNNGHGTFTYAFVLSGKGNRARMIETDASGIHGTGIMERQDATAFSTFAINGGYALGLEGVDSSQARLVALASIFPSGGGFVSGSSIDVNDGGQYLGQIVTFSGNDTVGANGRGTLSLSITGFAGGKFNFSIYVISASEFYLLSTDALNSLNPMFSGTAESQTGAPFVTSSFKGNSTFYETGITNHAPDVSVGLMTFNGTGALTVAYDENAGGFAQIANGANGTYSVSPNGRTTVNLVNTQTHAASAMILYGISPNTAFVMDESGSVRYGYAENLAVQPRFGDSDIAGRYTVASGDAVASATPLFSGAFNFDGNGDVSGNQDEDLTSNISLDQLVSGTYSIPPNSTSGRGNMLLTLPQSRTFGIWLATYWRAYGIPVDSSDVAPTVVILEQ